MTRSLIVLVSLLALAGGVHGAAFSDGASTATYLPLLLCAGAPWTSVTFDRYPDGTLVIEHTILEGDEFAALGILLAAAPETSYCAEATAAAILLRDHSMPFAHLTSSCPDRFACHTVPVEIRFLEPVRTVRLFFAGASQTYSLQAYDSGGVLIGTAVQDAVFQGGVFEVEHVSASANISRVTFGHTMSKTAIKELLYVR